MEDIATAGWLAGILGQAAVSGSPEAGFARVATDARKVEPGDLFVGLKGERFDGTDFAADAASRGASVLLVSRPVSEAGASQVVVPDTSDAFMKSAAAWRRRFPIPVISVAGSNGKTTTTQMIASILRARHGREGFLATQGNFNNSVGVPITLWRMREGHRAAVVEAGMSHPGEMAALAAMIGPTVALITNAQREHQEFLDGVEGSARENAESIRALPLSGTAVFPADDPCAGVWREAAGERKTLTFATRPGIAADVTAEVFSLGGSSELRIHTPLGEAFAKIAVPGPHNAHDALAASAASIAAGIPLRSVVDGLQSFRSVARRGVRHVLPGGAVLIDDTYNANPDSMRAAIGTLAALPRPRILVAGDMGEVGANGPAYHEEVGAYAKERGVDALLACGEMSRLMCRAFGDGAEHFEGLGDLARAAAGAAREMRGGAMMVKASNFMHFDAVVRKVLGGAAAAGR